MSGGGSAPSNTTSTTTTELPDWAQGTAQSLLARGTALSNQNMPVYTGQRSADLNGNQTAAMQMTANRATNGDATINAGAQSLQNTLNGDYLGYSAGTNPYAGTNPNLQAMIDQNAQDITRNYNSAVNATDSTMARAGAFGGSAWAQAQGDNSKNLADALSNSANTLNYQNYQQSAQLAENQLNRDQSAYLAERQNQLSAASPALQYGNQAYTDAQQLQSAGDTQYANDQQKLTDAQAQWTEQAQAPYASLDVLGNTIKAAVGGGSTISQSVPGTNNLAQLAGGASALYSLFG